MIRFKNKNVKEITSINENKIFKSILNSAWKLELKKFKKFQNIKKLGEPWSKNVSLLSIIFYSKMFVYDQFAIFLFSVMLFKFGKQPSFGNTHV